MIEFMLTNAFLAGIASFAVYSLGYAIRNAAVMHVLWVCVLLRLLAPPLLSLPIVLHVSGPEDEVVTISEAARGETMQGDSELIPGERAHLAHSVMLLPEAAVTQSQLLLAVWWAGATVVLAAVAMRLKRLRRIVIRSRRGDAEVERQIQRIGAEMGIRKLPSVHLVDARVSPMLWGLRRPKLLLPSQLWSRLSERERTAVLRHELAHLLRRDHWVRVVEVWATVVYWWCPFLWWARREIHRCEERCCDGWAVSFDVESRAALAQACLLTVDFISGGKDARLSPCVTPMAGFAPLRKRLKFILEEETIFRMSRRWQTILAFAALLLVVLNPVLGKEPAERLDEGRRVAIQGEFNHLRVTGPVDVTVRLGKVRSIKLKEVEGVSPRIRIDEQKRLVIQLTDASTSDGRRGRPHIYVTTPKVDAIEAFRRSIVTVQKLNSSELVATLDGGSRISVGGLCEALTVNASNAASFDGATLSTDLAVLKAEGKSSISLAKVNSLIESCDGHSAVIVAEDGRRSLMLRQ